MKTVLKIAATLCLVSGWAFAETPQAGRVGRAVIAGLTPNAIATHPDKTAHDYPKGRLALREGLALSEMHTIETDKGGRLCLVMTPGALVCVRPQSALKLDRLQQMTDGLPEAGKDLMRRVELSLTRGAILIHAGVPNANMSIRVSLPVGVVEANGGEFVLAEDQGSWFVGAYRDSVKLLGSDGSRQEVMEGKLLQLTRDGQGKVKAVIKDGGVDPLVQRFDMCLEFFPDLERFVFDPRGIRMGELAGWIGAPGGIVWAGDPMVWSDVSPSMRLPATAMSAATPVAGGQEPAGRWGRERIWEWYRSVGVIRGVNYLPRSAVNSMEFWQPETFNTNAIAEELTWAKQAGFNSVRVSLPYEAWAQDPSAFRKRFESFLDLAARRQLTVTPVLFDDTNIAGKDPIPGKQPDPIPGVHNSRWTPSPARALVSDRSKWNGLESYVRDMTGKYRKDSRILFWDLYNAPGSSGMGERSLALLESVFRWVRQERPVQPVSAAVWGDAGDAISARLMELSDLVTFQAFDNASIFTARLRACEAAQRPVMCTDWLKRQNGNTFPDILPLLSEKSVGWYSRGLVKGRAQLYIPDDRKTGGAEPELWQQDLLWPDGKAYDRKEVELIKAFQFIK